MKRSKSICISAAIFVVLSGGLGESSATESALDWPQFLGPDRNGISQEEGLLEDWPQDGPPVVWETNLGEGFSGISVADGRVFTMFTEGESEFVICFDDGSGKELWRQKTGPKLYESQGGNGPRSQPTVDGDRVFVLGTRGLLLALTAENGKQLWAVDLNKQLNSGVPKFGFSTSPLIEGELLLIESGGSKGTFLALDKKTGEVKWGSGREKVAYSSPIAVDSEGVRQVIFVSGKAAVSLSPSEGSVYWRFPWITDFDLNIAVPIFVPPDKVFISSGYNHGAAMLEIGKTADGLDVSKVWENRQMKNHFSTSVLKGDYIYGFDMAILKCIEVKTGKQVWRHRGYGKGSLILADGDLIILSDRGVLATAKATPEGYREKASASVLSGRCWTGPTLANGRLYVRDMNKIVCLDVNGS